MEILLMEQSQHEHLINKKSPAEFQDKISQLRKVMRETNRILKNMIMLGIVSKGNNARTNKNDDDKTL